MLKRILTDAERKTIQLVFRALAEKEDIVFTESGRRLMSVEAAEDVMVIVVEGVLRGEILPPLVEEA